MQIQSSSRANNVTRRQLFEHTPEAKEIVNRFEGDTVGELSKSMLEKAGPPGNERIQFGVIGGLAAAAGVAIGLTLSPIAGLAGVAFGAWVGWHALNRHQDYSRHRRDADKVADLAAQTEKALVTQQPDGTVVDRRFMDEDHFRNPHEVSRDGKVLFRSVELKLRDDEPNLIAREDCVAGTVTVSGPLGAESTFPGTLTLPQGDQEARVERHSDGTVLRFNDNGQVNVDLTGVEARCFNLGDGRIYADHLDGYPIVIQSPEYPRTVSRWETVYNGQVPFIAGPDLNVIRQVETPPLKALEIVDVRDKMPVVGAQFRSRKARYDLDYNAKRHEVTFSSANTDSVTVNGDLQSDGRVRMQQGKVDVLQTLDEAAVRLSVSTPAGEAQLVHAQGHAPQAGVPVKQLKDGSYKLELESGAVTVKPAVTLAQLRAYQDREGPTYESD